MTLIGRQSASRAALVVERQQAAERSALNPGYRTLGHGKGSLGCLYDDGVALGEHPLLPCNRL